MFPTATRSPCYDQLDQRIVPLVRCMNDLGIATYWSCEGHGANCSLVQSSYPKVSIVLARRTAITVVRLMGILGIHNQNSARDKTVSWLLVPSQDVIVSLQPENPYQPLEVLHDGIDALVENIRQIDDWFDPFAKK